MDLEQLENTQNDVVDITKPRRFGLLGVMQTTGPIESNISVTAVELDGGADGAAGGGLAEAEKAIENGTVLADIEALQVSRVSVVMEGIGRDGGEEVDIVIGVKPSDIIRASRERAVDLHPAMKGIMNNQVMRHPDAVRFHRVPLAVVVVADGGLVEVAHAALLSIGS